MPSAHQPEPCQHLSVKANLDLAGVALEAAAENADEAPRTGH